MKHIIASLAILLMSNILVAQDQPTTAPATQPAETVQATAAEAADGVSAVLDQAGGSDLVKWIVLVTVLSLAPALAVMVTSFTRIVVVLGLLRQALATPNLPPNQILFGLALLMTLVVMGPVLADLQAEAIGPWLDGQIEQSAALARTETLVRGFMIRQMDAADTAGGVHAFLPDDLASRDDLAWRDVPTWSMIPAFVLGELKVAFMIGLRIFLPFVIIDMLVAAVLVSMGMLMLPPVLIAMPLKLLMFVLADGWSLVAGTLVGSFA
jgi:flagellar biosynthetic protein FliP